MKMRELVSQANLWLAWRRITTGGNYQYKRYYRELYYAYEIALGANLSDLRAKLLGGTFEPQPPTRIYLPKASGLHRPLSLLAIEDQIVLQAFANLAAKRVQGRRDELQFKAIFSNILQDRDSIFFFRRWQDTYRSFQSRAESHFALGLRWVGDFDLAAFYDTISHELLMRSIYPRTHNQDLAWFCQCLQIWSSDQSVSSHGHGLPQGPIASDFLAECFLLPIDHAMSGNHGYARYVDDIRLFGATENQVRSYLIDLERHCRERGLIPQTGKFAIKRVSNIREAVGLLPSMADPQQDDGANETIRGQLALDSLRSSLSGKPYKIVDKSRLRYILFRAEPHSDVMKVVIRLIPRHPEHAEVFFMYLGRFGYRRPIDSLCHDLVQSNPYAFVRGEAWQLLARYRAEAKSFSATAAPLLTARALEVVRSKTSENFFERWGAFSYLSESAVPKTPSLIRLVKSQSPLLKALMAQSLPERARQNHDLMRSFFRPTTPEPGLAILPVLYERSLTLDNLGLRPGEIPRQVLNTLMEVGLVRTPQAPMDPIANLLASRYGTSQGKSWHDLLGAEYVHALGLLKQAEAAFDMGPSFWLACQNSFNQVLFLALQRHFRNIGHPGTCSTIDRTGRLVDFGVTLDSHGPFALHCPIVGQWFREANERRNQLPVSHPYAKKTASQNLPLRTNERNRLVSGLVKAYKDLYNLMP